ncbi:MAG TPA: homoserine dehydrogenase [Chloroflexi bacterium]|nr:homoserine dehydrogenase [Chloroflexota bacterium]
MQRAPILLLGVGGVGGALIRQIVQNRAQHAVNYDLELPILAVCDRDGAVVTLRDALDDATLLDVVDFKANKGRLSDHSQGGPQHDLAAVIDIAGQPGAIVVDCTATEATAPALLDALARGYRVVLANKKPLTIQQEVYDRLTRAGDTGNGRSVRQFNRTRWETTCGAGLPVIGTLNRLLASGDPVTRIAGAFSGTLGFVMSGLQDGQPFSAVVREAHRLGYTGPGPRDDLGGVDVARKALILARGLGWRLELADVVVTGLYPPELGACTVAEFMEALPSLDAHFRALVAEAAAAGKVLRYVATVADGKCSVGPQAVEANSPLGNLRGADNLVEFHTRWYQPTPLVIQGRGAGVDATAAGVLSDIVELALND